MSRRPLEVKLSAADRKQLRQILRAGIQQVRVVLRALALEQLSAGLTAPVVAKMVHLTPQAVRRIGHRYKRGGVPGALYERAGRGRGGAPSNCGTNRRNSGSSPWFVASRPKATPVGPSVWSPSRPSSRNWYPKWAARRRGSYCSATTSSRGGEKKT